MPLDINRHIDRVRAQPGNNWLALALKAIQDAINAAPVTTAKAATVSPATSVITAGGGGSGSSTPVTPTSTISVNGVPTNNDSVNFNNALPTAPAGMESAVWLVDNTLPKPNLSANVPVRASKAFTMMLMGA